MNLPTDESAKTTPFANVSVDNEKESVLAEKIKKAGKYDEFCGALIYGKQRIGKSSYAAKVMYQIYDDWDKVLDHFFFDVREVVSFLKKVLDEDRTVPVMCWDDCSVTGSGSLYHDDRELYSYVQHLLDVVGVSVNGFLLTTPSPKNVLKFLRGYEMFYVKPIRADSGRQRIAKGYAQYLLPSGKMMVKRVFEDRYSVLLPDEFYKKYEKVRKGYLKKAVDDLDEVLDYKR